MITKMESVIQKLNSALKQQVTVFIKEYQKVFIEEYQKIFIEEYQKVFIEEYQKTHEDFNVPDDFYEEYENFFIKEYSEFFDGKKFKIEEVKSEEEKSAMNRCKALKLDGDQCKSKHKKGELYCATHLKKMNKTVEQPHTSSKKEERSDERSENEIEDQVEETNETSEIITSHSMCHYHFTRGSNKNKRCQKPIVNNNNYCKIHLKNSSLLSAEMISDNGSEEDKANPMISLEDNQEYIEEYSFE